MLASSATADLPFYAAASQVILALLIAATIGESRLKVRRKVDARVAVAVVLLAALTVGVGVVAALRVLADGHDSEILFGLTVLSLSLGIGLVTLGRTACVGRNGDSPGGLAAAATSCSTSRFRELQLPPSLQSRIRRGA